MFVCVENKKYVGAPQIQVDWGLSDRRLEGLSIVGRPSGFRSSMQHHHCPFRRRAPRTCAYNVRSVTMVILVAIQHITVLRVCVLLALMFWSQRNGLCPSSCIWAPINEAGAYLWTWMFGFMQSAGVCISLIPKCICTTQF